MGLPEPVSGLVISYAYLWRHEREAGQEEGIKQRPCAIVVVVKGQDGEKQVTVAPITHSPPRDPAVAIEIPPRVKQHLGLDSERSWIILDDFNEFTWPGFDLYPVPGKAGCYDYGFLPPVLLRKIVDTMLRLRHEGRTFYSSRDE